MPTEGRREPPIWPAAPGDYLLVWYLRAAAVDVAIGRLGRFHLGPGTWVYAGSARGSGGLRARLERHQRPDKAPHWHVDYLSAALPPPRVIAVPEAPGQPLRLECAWVARLLASRGFSAPIPGFGSGDCLSGCPAHLVHNRAFVPLADLGRLCREVRDFRRATDL